MKGAKRNPSPDPRDEEHVASLKGMGHAITINRERCGMTREGLAPKCEMTVRKLELIERGEFEARWGDLAKIAKALDMLLPELFTQAKEHAPGPGGERWRRRSGEAGVVVRLPMPALDAFGEAELLDMDDRSAYVLRMRSGMADGGIHTYREIGDLLGVTPERVRQIQNQGLLLVRQVREMQRHLRGAPSLRSYRVRRPG